MAGCSKSVEVERRSIAMSASVGEVLLDDAVQTKADGVSAEPYTGIPSSDNKLQVALWFSYNPGSYSHNPELPQYLPCATTAIYENSARMDIKTGDNLLLYPIASDLNYASVGDEVYCVGFYPHTGWTQLTDLETNSSSHVINGSEDLMFADQIVGSYSENFELQRYNHLLTWVKVNLNATSLGAASVWGEVEYVKFVSPNKKTNIIFSEDLNPSVITYVGGPEELTLALPVDKSLGVTTRTFGQVFSAPPVQGGTAAAYGYTIKVKTRNLPEKEVFIALKEEDNVTLIESAEYAVGKLFVINLRFNDIAVVEGVCTLKQWEDQSSDIYLK